MGYKEQQKLNFEGTSSPTKSSKMIMCELPSLHGNDIDLELPFIQGWKRVIVSREKQIKHGKTKDIYYYTPAGKRLRSLKQVEIFLCENPSSLTVNNFSYSKKLIGIGEPYEIERKAGELLPKMRKAKDKKLPVKEKDENITTEHNIKEDDTSDENNFKGDKSAEITIFRDIKEENLENSLPTEKNLIVKRLTDEEEGRNDDTDENMNDVDIKCIKKRKSELVLFTLSAESTESTNSELSTNTKSTQTDNCYYEPLKIPFDAGWRRLVVLKINNCKDKGKVSNTFYFTPCNKKLGSIREVENYLKRSKSPLSVHNFYFGKTLIGVGEPLEIEKNAT